MDAGVADETRSEKIGRRLKTVPTRFVGFAVVTVLSPLLLVVALVIDVVRALTRRRPFMATRLLVMAWVYLGGESICIAGFGLTWLLTWGPNRQERMRRRIWRIQQWWAPSLFRPLCAMFGLTFTIEGSEEAEPGPVIVLIRHASIIDNLLPSVVVAGPHDLDLRYLIKRELRNDPGLDIGGDMLRNYFVRRGTGQEIERENIRRLADGLGPKDGILIFPEGTRFTPERRARAIEKLGERDPALAASAERMQYVLPPKPGGVLAILEGAPGVDVLLLAHAGFDMHVEESDCTSFSHAIHALRGASIKNCPRLAGVDAAPGSPPATPKPFASLRGSWRPAPPGATAVAYRSLPPESRAPPLNR